MRYAVRALVLMCLLLRGATAQTYSSGRVDVPLGTGETIDVPLVVPESFTIASASVHLRFTHQFDADLDVVLVPPGGVEYVHLMSDVGGSGEGEADVVFADDAAKVIHQAFTLRGRFRPEGGLARFRAGATRPIDSLAPLASLSSLQGRDAAGTWTLRIDDDAAADIGTLLEWSLTLMGEATSQSPEGVLRLLPAQARQGEPVVFFCDVAPGVNPVDPSITVTLDLQELNLPPAALRDDGQPPDAVAGDRRFSGSVSTPSDAPLGARRVTAAIRDSVGRESLAGADLRIIRPAPSNDRCEGAIELAGGAGGEFPLIGEATLLSGAGVDMDAPMGCAGGGPEIVTAAVWYRCLIPRAGRYRFVTGSGTNVRDTVLVVHRGSCESLEDLGCNDDSASLVPGEGLRSELVLDLAPGEYLIEVGLWQASAEPEDAVNVAVLEVTGACCIGDQCVRLPQSVCEGTGGQYQGDDTECEPTRGFRSVSAGAFEDIAHSGTLIELADDGSASAPLGFTFPFWNGAHERVFVNANGVISFASPVATWGNISIPSRLPPNEVIYLLWDDLDPSRGAVHVQTRGNPGADLRWIVQFTGTPQYGRSDSNTFQGVLFEDGRIEVRFAAVSGFAANDAVVGIENVTGAQGVGLDGSVIRSSTGVAWVPEGPVPICEVVPCLWPQDGCSCDYNGDDGVDGDDVIGFFTDWDRGRPCADVDQSDSVDGDDVISFFQCWDQGGSGFPGC